MLKKLNDLFKSISLHILPLSILFLISFAIILSWFRYGHLYGGGDVGLPIYDPVRLLGIVKNIWWDVHAPGFAYPTALTSIPLYGILSILQMIGLSNMLIQAILFGVLLFLMGAGMYLLFFEVSDSKSKTLSFIAAIFYMFNPYMITQVWHRFVHTAFFLAALIPILTFIYIKIFKTRGFFWFLSFIIISLIFSYVYGSLPFMVAVWIPISVYSFWKAIESRSLKGLVSSASIFLLMFVSWLISNVWWFYPFWTTGPAIFTQVHSIYASIQTFISLANQNTMPMIIRGINSFYVFGENAWVLGYDNFLMQIISWTFPIITLIGIYSILIKRSKSLYVWVFLFFVGIFVSKGMVAPFGYPFLWLFSKSFFLGAFRNSFEKLGIIIPFASAFIFPIGIYEIYSWLKNKTIGKKFWPITLVSLILILELVVYSWPMWKGEIFGSENQPAFVEVPKEYKEADEWIQKQKTMGRILHLPFASGDAVTYLWENGYNGIEPSSLFFGTPSISQGFGLDLLDNDLAAIRTVFSTKDLNKDEIINVLSGLNIRFIVLHKDVDWKARKLLDPESIEKLVLETKFLEQKAEFGDLIIYEFDENFSIPKTYTTNVSDILTGGDKYFSLWPEIFYNRTWPISFTTPINGNEEVLSSYKDADFSIAPTQVIDIPSSPLAYKENALAELPSPRFLPSSPFYFLILLKEKIQIFSTPILNRHSTELTVAGKRLVESYMLSKNGNTDLANHTMERYLDQLDIALNLITQKSRSGLINDTEKLILQREFARHEILLAELNDTTNLDNLKAKLSKMGFIPFYDLKEDLGMNKYGRRVYRFDVQKEASYEILLKDFSSKELYQNSLDTIPVQIDNNVLEFKTTKKGGFMSLGQIKLSPGLHEFSYDAVNSMNLVPELGSNEWEKTGMVDLIKDGDGEALEFTTTKDSVSEISVPLKDFDNTAIYRIDVDFWIKNGQGPNLQVQQSSDWDVKGERFMDINKLYSKGNYNFFWNDASETFWPRTNANSAVVKIISRPWNNCLEILIDWNICQNKQISQKYNRESDFIIKNLSVKRLFVNDILLKSSEVKSINSETEEVVINQKSPSDYEGKLNLTEPTSLFFLNTFHPEWQLSLIKDGKTKVIPENKHFLANGYGNAWYLDEEPGLYRIKIEFVPQRRFYKGVVFSILGTLLLGISVYVYFSKKGHKKGLKKE